MMNRWTERLPGLPALFGRSVTKEPFTPAMWVAAATCLVAFSGDLFRYTVGWIAYFVIVFGLVITSIVMLVRSRHQLRLRHLPLLLLLFVVWCGVTVFWSDYPGETMIGWGAQLVPAVAAACLAATLTRAQFIRAFGLSLRFIVVGSLLFELGVELFTGDGLIPPSYLYGPDLGYFFREAAPKAPSDFPAYLYWSYARLFDGGAIQGLPGNRNLLCMIALLAIIVSIAQWLVGQLGTLRVSLSVILSVLTLWLTRSVTVFIAALFVALAVVLVLIGRRVGRRGRWTLYVVVGTVLVSGAIVTIFNYDMVFTMLNRSPDMSGRGDIWRSVAYYGSLQPWTGQGWIGYWMPWVPELAHLAIVEGTPYQQAHNTFLDVWMQTGTIGLILFSAAVLTTLIRTWWTAIAPADYEGAPGPTAVDAVPFLVILALVVQSMTESRLIVEGGWMLLVYAAVSSKLQVRDVWFAPRHTLGTPTGPIDLTPVGTTATDSQTGNTTN